MNGFQGLIEFLLRNPLQSLFFFVIALSILRRLVKQASEDQARRNAGGPLQPPAPDDDLREKVRRGFEEMMRQRAAAAKGTPKGTPSGPQRVVTNVAPRNAPRIAPKPAPKAPRLPVAAPAVDHPPAIDVVVARAAAARTTALAAARLLGRRSPPPVPSIARRLLKDRASVRRAFLLREILDAPRSMRTGS
jgi:hypothetical protein